MLRDFPKKGSFKKPTDVKLTTIDKAGHIIRYVGNDQDLLFKIYILLEKDLLKALFRLNQLQCVKLLMKTVKVNV